MKGESRVQKKRYRLDSFVWWWWVAKSNGTATSDRGMRLEPVTSRNGAGLLPPAAAIVNFGMASGVVRGLSIG